MTNLLVFAIVVSHSCITSAHIQEDSSGTSISPDEVSVSVQPVSQAFGAAPSPKPAAQTGLTTPSKDASSDELTYKAHLASARAFVKAKEKAKAIESYEKAILTAPNERCREAVIEELSSFSARLLWRSFADSFMLFLQKILPFLFLFLIVPLYLLLRRAYRWFKGLLRRKKLYRIVVVPTSGSEFASYFCNLIQSAHDSFEEQYALVRQIGLLNSMTVTPTFQSAKLLAALPYSLPNVLASKWWAQLAKPLVNIIDPPNYILYLGVSNAEKQYGLIIRLCRKGRFLAHWHESCTNVDIHSIFCDLAYKVVEIINQHERKRHYGT